MAVNFDWVIYVLVGLLILAWLITFWMYASAEDTLTAAWGNAKSSTKAPISFATAEPLLSTYFSDLESATSLAKWGGLVLLVFVILGAFLYGYLGPEFVTKKEFLDLMEHTKQVEQGARQTHMQVKQQQQMRRRPGGAPASEPGSASPQKSMAAASGGGSWDEYGFCG